MNDYAKFLVVLFAIVFISGCAATDRRDFCAATGAGGLVGIPNPVGLLCVGNTVVDLKNRISGDSKINMEHGDVSNAPFQVIMTPVTEKNIPKLQSMYGSRPWFYVSEKFYWAITKNKMAIFV